MNQTEVMLAIVEVARGDGALSPEDAISLVASMIDRQEMSDPIGHQRVEDLLRIGATIWKLAGR